MGDAAIWEEIND